MEGGDLHALEELNGFGDRMNGMVHSGKLNIFDIQLLFRRMIVTAAVIPRTGAVEQTKFLSEIERTQEPDVLGDFRNAAIGK